MRHVPAKSAPAVAAAAAIVAAVAVAVAVAVEEVTVVVVVVAVAANPGPIPLSGLALAVEWWQGKLSPEDSLRKEFSGAAPFLVPNQRWMCKAVAFSTQPLFPVTIAIDQYA